MEAKDGARKTDWRSIYVVTLVAFIGSVHTHCIAPGVWPYMKMMDPAVTENFYGLLHSVASFGTVLTALIAGYISNVKQDTKWPMVFGKAMALFSCVLYLMIELMNRTERLGMFLMFEFFLGMSMGAAQIYRTHIAMASTEKDRPRAVGISSLAPAIGLFLGPVGQILFTAIGYPGIPLLGVHLNLYTAPIWMTIVISIVGIYLLVCHFNGRMDQLGLINKDFQEKRDYDVVAVVVCLITKMLVSLCTLNFMTIGPPYTMTVFQWTPSQSVLYLSVCMGLVGLNIVFWNCAYVFFDLRRRLSERRAIIFAIFCLFIAYMVTYPWWFLNGTIEYANTTVIMDMGLDLSDVTVPDSIGCNPAFAWCADTPAVNMIVFLGSLIVVLGFALPLCLINLDILFSKVLGNIRQGTMQGLFIVSGECLNIIGPIFLTRVYTYKGPRPIWIFEIIFIVICFFLWIIFYNRMIGHSKRVATLSQISEDAL
ncbi:unnamed protein product [Bursaphelenchus xylophilus]|uniref:(pine wood nematode) hypothetical protein n=1 Tax=Bursaphelenchus xylophilus TaxID=6326 RepID=A0A1I7RS12_BURXY|nr:unnamed protein product [Bursaphelenchus xylophilus]CAG9123331.1 unnamed protein product [Bursaphelenchus xylophilus]